MGQGEDVLLPGPQWRDVDADDVEPVEEVGAEEPPLDLRLQIVVVGFVLLVVLLVFLGAGGANSRCAGRARMHESGRTKSAQGRADPNDRNSTTPPHFRPLNKRGIIFGAAGGRTRNLQVRHGCLQATTYTIFIQRVDKLQQYIAKSV